MEHECDCTLLEEHLTRCPGVPVLPLPQEEGAALGDGLRRRGPSAAPRPAASPGVPAIRLHDYKRAAARA